MRSSPALSFSAAALVACAASQERPPEAPPEVVVAPPPPAASSPAVASASAPPAPPALPPLPPPIAEVSDAACKLGSAPDARATMDLFLPGKDRSLGWLDTGVASVALPPTGKGAPVADVLSPAARVRAQTRLASLSVFSKSPVVMEGVFSPRSSSSLRITRLDASSVTVERALQSRAFRVSVPVLSASVSCSELSLSSASFDRPSSLPDASAAKPARLRDGQTFALRSSEKGDPVVEITTPPPPRPNPKQKFRVVSPFDPGKVDVSIVKTSGKQSLVVFDSNDGVFFGWVPGAALMTPPKPSASGFGMLGALSGLGLPARDSSQPPSLLCDAEMPLLVEQDGTRALLGSTLAGACIELREKGAEFSRVGIHKAGFSTRDKVSLFIPTVSLAGCHPVDKGKVPPPCEGSASDENDNLWGALGEGLGAGGLGLSGQGFGSVGTGLGVGAGTGGLGTRGAGKGGDKKK